MVQAGYNEEAMPFVLYNTAVGSKYPALAPVAN